MTTHKSNKNSLFWAMVFGAGLFLLIQMMANLFLQGRDTSRATPSKMMAVAPHSSGILERPSNLFADEFFSSPFMIDSDLIRQMQEIDRQFEAGGALSTMLRSTSPWKDYSIKEDDKKVTVTVSVPDSIRPEDIHVEVIGGSVMHISGGHKTKDGSATSETRFDKRFALGRTMDEKKIAANLKDGVLTVTAPKQVKEEKKKVRKIPISTAEL